MAVVAPVAHAHHDPLAGPRRLQANRVGLWLFVFSESIIFGLLLSARFYLEGTHREHLDQQLGLLVTVVLLASSVTAYIAETAIEHGNNRLGHWMLLATIVQGLVFAGGVITEWNIAEFGRGESFGSVYFTMTGIHASHVLSGIVMLALAWWFAFRGKYSRQSHWGASGVVMYWHFVDVVWVFYYPALYLL